MQKLSTGWSQGCGAGEVRSQQTMALEYGLQKFKFPWEGLKGQPHLENPSEGAIPRVSVGLSFSVLE